MRRSVRRTGVELKGWWNRRPYHELYAKAIVVDLSQRLIELRLRLFADRYGFGSPHDAHDPIRRLPLTP